MCSLIFVFLVETVFHHVGQASLKLWTSGNSPTSASQSAGITNVSHSTWPDFSVSIMFVVGFRYVGFIKLRIFHFSPGLLHDYIINKSDQYISYKHIYICTHTINTHTHQSNLIPLPRTNHCHQALPPY